MTDSPRSKLLVPVDFSDPSKRALGWALDFAAHRPAEIHVLHVVERVLQLSDLTAGFDNLKSELEEVKSQAETQMAKLTESERTTVGMLRQHVASGKPAGEIVRVAEDLGVDMIVMGTHGLTGVERIIIGSVAEQVMRRAGCTVVAVKAPRD